MNVVLPASVLQPPIQDWSSLSPRQPGVSTNRLPWSWENLQAAIIGNSNFHIESRWFMVVPFYKTNGFHWFPPFSCPISADTTNHGSVVPSSCPGTTTCCMNPPGTEHHRDKLCLRTGSWDMKHSQDSII